MRASAKPKPKQDAEPQEVSVAEAKAKLSSLLHSVETKHHPLTILRRGVPIAQIIPFPGTPKPSFLGSMKGTGRILGDIVNPYMEEWTVGDE